ncbi:MAG: S8 family serine peptidase [Clostridia bacterium]|nr:S8 family serine peptidase [Clostridia bacterium]
MKLTKKILATLMMLCLLLQQVGLSALAVDKMTNDPGSARQWGMKAIGMDKAWCMGLTGKGVKVGVIDCGLSTATGDIAASRVEAGPNYTGSVGNSATDIEGHGTFVAGIIGAAKDNGVGIAGVAPECNFYMVKALSDMTQAVKDCVNAGCQVINLSMGTPSAQEAAGLKPAIDAAVAAGVIVVGHGAP